MNTFITALTDTTTGITADTFFSLLVDLTPYFVMIVPVVLGIYLIIKLSRFLNCFR